MHGFPSNSTKQHRLAPKFGCRFYLPSTSKLSMCRGLLLPWGWTPPLLGDEIFLLKISMGMDRLTNSKQLLFYKVFTESQYFSTYSRVETSIFQQKKHVFRRFFTNNSENKYFMKKIIRSKNVAYKKTKKILGLKYH